MFCLCNLNIFAQNNLNLDFEITRRTISLLLPEYWLAEDAGSFNYPKGEGYKVYLDTLEKHSGKYSLKMEMFGVRAVNSFGVFTSTLPVETFAGKNVEFRGWIKTKDVKNGYAGLWLRVNGAERSVLGFDNMQHRGLSGNNDWTQVSIKMEISKDAVNIYFGGLFPGEGVAWFDNLELFINGEKY